MQLLEQRLLVEKLLRLREQLQGSLFARYGVCGKENCICRQGRKHGPYYVLSTRSGGKGGFAYLKGRRAFGATGHSGRDCAGSRRSMPSSSTCSAAIRKPWRKGGSYDWESRPLFVDENVIVVVC